jgi:peptidoglycan/LPS O-acetylase OafA/YrhL
VKPVTVADLHIRGRIEGFDGLRAIATLTVVLVHMQLLNKVGWVAVQEFFLMSGFLITRVLLDLKVRYGGRRYAAEFATFRVLRIFPAYFAYLTLLAIGAAFLAMPGFWDKLSGQLGYLYSYTFNYAWLFDEQYRSPWAAHLWSLCVEEQFYLIWPFVIWFTPLHRLKAVLLVLVALGPVFRGAVLYWANRHAPAGMDPYAIIYLVTPSYLDVFAMGALLCFNDVRRALASISNRMFLVLILATIAIGMAANTLTRGFDLSLVKALGYPILMPHAYQALWGYTMVSLLMMVLLAKVTEHGFGRKVFTHPVPDRIGKVAYSMYLVHHGLILVVGSVASPFLMAQFGVSNYVATLIWAPLYLVLLYYISSFSFEWIEQPPMKLKRKLFARPSTGENAKPASQASAP